MSPNLLIAFRFLTAKKRAMLMSLSCTVLGVGLFIVTQATTSGFEEFFIKTILGTDGAMRVEDKMQDTIRSMNAGGGSEMLISHREGVKYIEGVEEPKLVVSALRNFENVSGTSAVLRGNVVVRSSFKNESAQVFGINLEEHLKVSDLQHQIVQGDLAEFREAPTGALIGKVLAERLELEVGNSFILDCQGQLRRYRVSAIYETGVRDIDKTRVYVHIGEARSLLKKPIGVTFIQINLFDKDRAPKDALRMQDVIRHSAQPWQEREKAWLEAFRALSVSSAITVSVFTLIAGLAMFNTLAMIVLEKTKDIAILRSMGYERRDITEIFLWQAAIVLVIGALAGAAVGVIGTFAVSRIPLPINGIFKTETFQVSWSLWHYIEAVLTAAIMVMAASIIPARRAARLEPGDIVRGTAQ
ncbi:MAG TPA: FtsX-like permease family protein [Opitutaceae bacterium]|nr:FtsX-like permease family protein [Opitutaceae bacterium]HND62648.1 FtsX-like permease family protein [Opitutaceae bacterium]